MFARIAIGILLGFVAGLVESGVLRLSARSKNIAEALLFVVGVSFVGASFMFTAIYGLMAIAELVIGFYAFRKAFDCLKAKS